MKVYGVVEVKLHAFLISALDVEDWLPSRHGHFTTAESAIAPRLFGGWEEPGVGTKIMERIKISLPCQESNHEPRSPSLWPSHYTNWATEVEQKLTKTKGG
jgi:hypothetical protein